MYRTELLQKLAVERVIDPGAHGFIPGYLWYPKENGKLRSVIDLSVLNYIRKQPFNMETTKSIRHSTWVNEWVVKRPYGCLSTFSKSSAIKEVPPLRFWQSDQFTVLSFEMSRNS